MERDRPKAEQRTAETSWRTCRPPNRAPSSNPSAITFFAGGGRAAVTGGFSGFCTNIARRMSPTKLCAALSKDARTQARLSRNQWPPHLPSAQRLALWLNRAGTSTPTKPAPQHRPSKRSVPAFRPRKEPLRSNLFARSTSEKPLSLFLGKRTEQIVFFV